MKILILNDKFPPEAKGGADIMSFRFALKLVELGHQVVVFTTTEIKSSEGEFIENKIKIYRLFFKFYTRFLAYIGLYNPKTVSKLKAIIKKEKPDLVWANNVHCALSYACLRKAKKMGLPVVLSLHDTTAFCYRAYACYINPGNLSVSPQTENYKHHPRQCLKCQRLRYFPLRNLFIKYFLRFVDKIVAVTAEHQKVLSLNGVRCDTYVYNGIDPYIVPTPEKIKEFKDRFGLSDKKVIFWGGRINKACGVKQTVLALKEAIKQIPNAVLLVAAKINPASEALVKEAASLGLAGKVIVTGWLEREDLAIIYQICDLAVCASIAFETFGLVPLEAMAAKKPAMATCFGGPREVISDGITGYIFNPFNVQDYSEKIIKILTDVNLAKNMGEAGYKKYIENFTMDKIFSDYLAVFSELLKTKK